MSKKGRWINKIVAALIITLAIVALALLLVPRYVDQLIEKRISAELASQGLRAEWGELDWHLSGEVTVRGLELFAAESDELLANLDVVNAQLDVEELRAGNPHVTLLELGELHLEPLAILDYVQARERQPEDSSDTEQELAEEATDPAAAPAASRSERLSELLPSGVSIGLLEFGELPSSVPPEIADMSLAELSLRPGEDGQWIASAKWASPAQILLPAPLESLELSGVDSARAELHLDEDFKLRELHLSADNAITLSERAGDLSASLEAISTDLSSWIRLDSIRATTGDELSVNLSTALLRLTNPFTNIGEMRMERLEVEELGISLVLAAAPDEDSARGPGEDSGEDGGEDAAGEEPDSGEDTAGTLMLPEGWEGRPIWEQLPQFIEIERLSINIERGADRLEADLEYLRYGLRVLQSRLELSLKGSAQLSDRERADITLRGYWNYNRSEPGFDLEIDRLDLAALHKWLPQVPELDQSLDLKWSLADSRGEFDMRSELSLRLEPLGRAESAFRLRSISYDTVHGIKRQPGRRQNWSAESGALSLDDFEMGLELNLDGLRIDRWPPLQEGRVRVSLDERPAQDTWDSLPRWITSNLGQPRLIGRFGLDVEWGFEVIELESGKHSLRFKAPWRSQLHDSSLRIESMSGGEDPRQLNGAFNFTFRGPEDRIMRNLYVPPSVSVSDEPTPPLSLRRLDPYELFQDPDQPWNNEDWVRLDDISWYLIAMQLYREDGSFFRNDGVNWYQLRRVIEEAVDNRRLGRGASTITMQLVKNVLLSHDRSLQRKVQEIILTYWVTRLVPKERILEIYLNIIEWGPDLNGITEAAQYYFNKHPRELNLGESAWLSAITPSPARYSVQYDRGQVSPGFWRLCQDLMRGMQRNGWITESELARGLEQRPVFTTSPCDDDCLDRSTSGLSELQSLFSESLAQPLEESSNRREPVAGLLRLPPSQRVYLMINSSRALSAHR